MATQGTASKMTSVTRCDEWYLHEGWKVFNTLLSELEESEVRTVWVENFESIRVALNKISRKELVSAFNRDSLNWQLRTDDDGTLFAILETTKNNGGT